MGRIIDANQAVKSIVKKEEETYLLHDKKNQGQIDAIISTFMTKLGEALDLTIHSQFFYDAEATKRPCWRLGAHNRILKSYAKTLMARYGNPQDDDAAPANVEGERGGTKTNTSELEATSQQDIITSFKADIDKLATGIRNLEKESEHMKKRQQQMNLALTEKIAAHIQPIREEMKQTYKEQQNKLGAKISELKSYCTEEQDQREQAQKQEEKMKDLVQNRSDSNGKKRNIRHRQNAMGNYCNILRWHL